MICKMRLSSRQKERCCRNDRTFLLSTTGTYRERPSIQLYGLFELWTCGGHHLGRIQNVPHLYSHNRTHWLNYDNQGLGWGMRKTSVFTSSMLASRRARRRSSHGSEAEKWLNEQPLGSQCPPRTITSVNKNTSFLRTHRKGNHLFLQL